MDRPAALRRARLGGVLHGRIIRAMLIASVVLYLLVTIAIGLWAAMRVKNSKDYVVAGRSLPLYMSTATVFATWFGAESVLSVSAEFSKSGLGGIVADPFGSSVCLVIVALLFARAFYHMDLLTIGDFYHKRYGRAMELGTSVVIAISYLGWTAAQLTALGLVFSTLTNGAISLETGIVISGVVVLAYTIWGGMWSVAMTDLFQSVMIIVGLGVIAWFVGDMAGGPGKIIAAAAETGKFEFWPKGGAKEWLDPAAGHLPARHLREEREDRGRRQPARRGRLLHLRVRSHLHRLRRAPHRSVTRPAAVGPGCARDTTHPARVHPRPHAHVDTGALLRRPAVGDPVDGERGDHRPDLAVHGKHHPSALSEHERQPVPPHASRRPGVLHIRCPGLRPAFEANDVRHGAERLHRNVGGGAGAARGGNLLEESEQYGRDPIRGVRTRRLADRGFHRGGRRRAADARRPRVLHLRHGPRRYRAKRRAAGASPQRPPLVRSRPDSATIRAAACTARSKGAPCSLASCRTKADSSPISPSTPRSSCRARSS